MIKDLENQEVLCCVVNEVIYFQRELCDFKITSLDYLVKAFLSTNHIRYRAVLGGGIKWQIWDGFRAPSYSNVLVVRGRITTGKAQH
jgi:hypothetical protein